MRAVSEAATGPLAVSAVRAMREAGYDPGGFQYERAVTACNRDGLWKLSLELFTEMQRDGLDPSPSCEAACLEVAKRQIYLSSFLRFSRASSAPYVSLRPHPSNNGKEHA